MPSLPLARTALRGFLRSALLLLALALLVLTASGQQAAAPAPPPDVPKLIQQAHDLQKAGKLDDAIDLLLKNGEAVKQAYGDASQPFAQWLETMADLLVAKTKVPAGQAGALTPEQVSKTLNVAGEMYRRALDIQKKSLSGTAAQRRLERSLEAIGQPVEQVYYEKVGPDEPPPAAAAAGDAQQQAEEAAAHRQAEEMMRAEEERQRAEELRRMEEERRRREEAEGAKAEAKKSEEAGGGQVEAVPVPAIPAPTPTPAPPEPPVTSQKKAEYTFPDETVEGNLEKPPSDRLERFPTIESPDAVVPGQEFAVQVSLTEEQLTPEAKVQQGATTAEGKLALALPQSAENQWPIDVVLSAPGLDFARGSNTGAIVLPRQGDSTVAIFYLRARPSVATEKPVHLMATLWYRGSYLARIERDLVVRSPQSVAAKTGAPPAAGAPPPAEAAARSESKAAAAPAARAAAEETEAAAPSTPQQRRAALDLGFVPPDLTVVILTNPGDSTDTLILESPHLQPAQYTVPRARGLAEWLAAQYRQIAARSSRGMQPADEAAPAADRKSTDAFLRGFGRQLYLQFAPAPFREAFWKLEDTLGPKFHTIQIFTDDPTLPWELMRPVRADGTGERDFLGLEFSVARWHVAQDTAQLERPPQIEPLEKVVVIAPRYKGETALPAQSAELTALAQFSGYSPLEGDMEALRGLFQDLPRGLVHFAGHGAVAQQPGSPQFAILLEDGPLDLMTWRGLAPLRQQHHPVFFFNACEVGQSQKVANFVDGWAPAVLHSGASGYIGALWPVNDRVAALFAARFYQGMERELAAAGGRARVSDVLTETRRQVFRETGDPTALAYVFYGDPNLAFARVR